MLPDGVRIYAVGDIHGCKNQLDRLLDMIVADAHGIAGRCTVVFLGDYVDRGPDSKGVVACLVSSPLSDFEVFFIRGNHEQSLLDFLTDPEIYRIWKSYGAEETLMSYGVSPPRFERSEEFIRARDQFVIAFPAEHRTFLSNLRYSVSIGDYYFSHAGARPGMPLAEQAPEDLLWIREEFLESDYDFGKTVVHGHTPTNAPVIRPNRIGVDTGAYATGRLTAVVLEGSSTRFLHT